MSWQHESGAMWLRDFLPKDVPNAQVFTYGYPSTLQKSGSRARLLDYTTHFLQELLRLHEYEVWVVIPIWGEGY